MEYQIKNSPKKRRRIKTVLTEIKHQVEFYLSDANLFRDKFLLEKVGKHGTEYISIQLLLTFNRLKSLNATSYMICRSLQYSATLEVDAHKQNVRRRLAYKAPTDFDHCTLYLEGLPANATIDWMKAIFNKLGFVRYISLPTFKRTGLCKGHAFVEFSRQDVAFKACCLLKSTKYLLPDPILYQQHDKQVVKSAILQADKTKQILNKYRRLNGVEKSPKQSVATTTSQVTTLKRKRSIEDGECGKKLAKYEQQVDKKDVNHAGNKTNTTANGFKTPTSFVSKRKRAASKDGTDETIQKSCKIDSTSSSNVDDLISFARNLPQQHKKNVTVEKPALQWTLNSNKRDSSTEADNSKLPKLPSTVIAVKGCKKRSRKRNRRKVLLHHHNHQYTCSTLKVMLKTDWLELKRQYLHQQRDEMGKLKSIMQNNTLTESHTRSGFIKHHLALNEFAEEKKCVDASDLESLAGSAIDIRERMDYKVFDEGGVGGKRGGVPVFTPGVIISVECSNKVELPTFLVLKRHFTAYGFVCYVDISQDKLKGFVRFKTCEAAQRTILEEKKFIVSLLIGAQEESYWDKLLASRQLKRSVERRKQRGREKIQDRAQSIMDLNRKKHIKFNKDF